MSKAYQVIFDRRAEKELESLPQTEQKRIQKAVDSLASNPRPPGAIKMSGSTSWRIRVGDYRVIYSIQDQVLIVLVLKIGHRRDIYR
ncbi:MAG: type II toxin-antitoxin system RelE/ParE family toxin [Prosthecobacter sp.]|uniref:type II toxin-antitoxin system RelE family toxin n=1 Tax=Prosthecobacter sp. TaxID=1965333 RepID=UPI0019E94150|nr:type II toxin-antitoxin system RelE/ParE family toxin [Prosthecobacter sp.]MBE2287275.1 type II toxin-antitoxin system RelE/ParE family toxin [Prosthecobacter sp.]